MQSYMAPEMLGNGEESLSYHSAVDIWAVGVVTHEMLARRTPFRSVSKATRGKEQPTYSS